MHLDLKTISMIDVAVVK